jgi:hypothetical protein
MDLAAEGNELVQPKIVVLTPVQAGFAAAAVTVSDPVRQLLPLTLPPGQRYMGVQLLEQRQRVGSHAPTWSAGMKQSPWAGALDRDGQRCLVRRLWWL